MCGASSPFSRHATIGPSFCPGLSVAPRFVSPARDAWAATRGRSSTYAAGPEAALARELQILDSTAMSAPQASKLRVALVRGPVVSTARSVNNEATPCIGLAYVSAYVRAHGYATTIVDAI